jgi:hypothetical protein
MRGLSLNRWIPSKSDLFVLHYRINHRQIDRIQAGLDIVVLDNLAMKKERYIEVHIIVNDLVIDITSVVM